LLLKLSDPKNCSESRPLHVYWQKSTCEEKKKSRNQNYDAGLETGSIFRAASRIFFLLLNKATLQALKYSSRDPVPFNQGSFRDTMNAPSLKRDGKKSVKKELREPEETVQVCSVVILFPISLFASLLTSVADP
jgi:hypothetical protein